MRRNAVHLGISSEEVSVAMMTGCLDVLTLVEEINIARTIKYLKNKIPNGKSDKWAKFWAYFQRTWMTRYPFETWNIHHMQYQDTVIQNRTNNALESFNAKLNAAFSKSHPSIFQFVDVIKLKSLEFVRYETQTRRGVCEIPNRPLVPDRLVPYELTRFLENETDIVEYRDIDLVSIDMNDDDRFDSEFDTGSGIDSDDDDYED